MKSGQVSNANNEAVELRKTGLMHREIAVRQGRSLAAVRSALERARISGALPAGIKAVCPPIRYRVPARPRKAKFIRIEVFARTEVLAIDAVGATLREVGGQTYHMRAIDVIPCARCGLRGHVAGDPDRCLHGSATRGLGGEMASQPMRRRAA